MTDNIHKLAEEYLNKSGESLEDEIKSLKDEIQNRKGEKKEYEGLSDDDPVIQEINQEIEEKKEQLQELEEEVDSSESLEVEFLEAVWNNISISDIDETVAQAINKALLGEEKNSIKVKGNEVPIELGELSKPEARKCAYQVKMLAKDKLQGAEVVQNMWEAFSSSVKYEPFKHVASSNEGISPKEVSDELDEERKTINNRLLNPRHHQPLDPYHKEDGKYKLSLVGEYLWEAYASEDANIEKQSEDDKQEINGESNQENTKTGEDFWDEFSSD